MNRTITALIAAAALWGCTGNETSAYTDTGADGWVYGDTVRLRPSDSDSTAMTRGDIDVAIRHTNNYEYSNIWLRVEYTGADTVRADTVNLRMADDLGNWLGKGLDTGYQLRATVLRGVELDAASDIKLTHIMRADTLADILQAGIMFVPSKQ